jgi:hypothetical protein
VSISYGSYTFPTPPPFFAIGDEPIYVAGQLDSTLTKITLVGALTGANLQVLSQAKKALTSGLLNEFQTLSISGDSFTYCKPIGISFADSDLTRILPYTVEFERFDEKDFSQYFGVVNPTNTWSYQEQDGRVVQASHSVSAQGVKTSAADPLTNARNFVSGLTSGFYNLSVINPSGIAFLQSKTEEIDRFSNSYSCTENYIFSTSREPISNSAIVSASMQVSHSRGGEASVNVDGSIIGSITGAIVTTGIFTAIHAQEFARNALEKSKSVYESSVYGALSRGPSTFNYNVNEQENKIDFGFEFRDPFSIRTGEVLHDYSVSVSASKDNNSLTANIDGTFSYDSALDLFIGGGNIESGARYLKVKTAFENENFYNLALAEYSAFIDVVSGYEVSKYLNPIPLTESITKNPFTQNISYSFSYDNKVDYSSGQLKNLSFSITDSLPIPKTRIDESNNGFATQETVTRTLGKISVNSSAQETATGLLLLSGIVEEFLIGKKCQVFDNNWTTGDSSINYSISSYY